MVAPRWPQGPPQLRPRAASGPLPLGGEGGPPPAFSSAGAGRVRGSRACADRFAAQNAGLKAFGNDYATSSTLSRKHRTGLRRFLCHGIDPLTPGPSPPRGRGGKVETRRRATRQTTVRALKWCLLCLAALLLAALASARDFPPEALLPKPLVLPAPA